MDFLASARVDALARGSSRNFENAEAGYFDLLALDHHLGDIVKNEINNFLTLFFGSANMVGDEFGKPLLVWFGRSKCFLAVKSSTFADEIVSKLISAAISFFRLLLREVSQKGSHRCSTAPRVFLFAFLVSPEKLKLRYERVLKPSRFMFDSQNVAFKLSFPQRA